MTARLAAALIAKRLPRTGNSHQTRARPQQRRARPGGLRRWSTALPKRRPHGRACICALAVRTAGTTRPKAAGALAKVRGLILSEARLSGIPMSRNFDRRRNAGGLEAAGVPVLRRKNVTVRVALTAAPITRAARSIYAALASRRRRWVHPAPFIASIIVAGQSSDIAIEARTKQRVNDEHRNRSV